MFVFEEWAHLMKEAVLLYIDNHISYVLMHSMDYGYTQFLGQLV